MTRFFLPEFLIFLPIIGMGLPNQARGQFPLHPPARSDAQRSSSHASSTPSHVESSIASPVEPVLTAADMLHMRDLITQLTDVVDPDYGQTPMMNGLDFAPLPELWDAPSIPRTEHNFKQSPAMRELVKLGPRALPLLLEHLDDATPTKLTIKHNLHGIGAMKFGHELDFNEANPREKKLKTQARQDSFSMLQPSMDSYTVKIGDICFNIIGQIVGRSYLTVEYQPEACIFITSPVADTSLAQKIRDVWTSSTSAKDLFHSLLTDYSCQGVDIKSSPDKWFIGSNLQCEAAMRLLYYFPKETTALIAHRLHNLKVERMCPTARIIHAEEEMVVLRKREHANGVSAEKFVKAISWCTDPRIQTEMGAIMNRTEDLDVMIAALRGIPPSHRKSLTPRVQTFLRSKRCSAQAGSYEAYRLLETLAHYWDADARPIFDKFIQDRDPVHLFIICEALWATKTNWDVSILKPLLSDRRPIPDTAHWQNPERKGRQIRTRVCDVSARALATWRSGMKFDMEQTSAQLDNEIATISVRIRK